MRTRNTELSPSLVCDGDEEEDADDPEDGAEGDGEDDEGPVPLVIVVDRGNSEEHEDDRFRRTADCSLVTHLSLSIISCLHSRFGNNWGEFLWLGFGCRPVTPVRLP